MSNYFQTLLNMASAFGTATNNLVNAINSLGQPRPQINELCDLDEKCRPTFMLEEHMTVLRKGPTMPLTLEMYQFEEGLADVNPVTEGTAVAASFTGSKMDQSSNFADVWSTASTAYQDNTRGTAIDGTDISMFYTRGKVQKTVGDELVIPINTTASGEDWESGDQLIIKYSYIDIYGNDKTASCRVEIINPAQERYVLDNNGYNSYSAPWAPKVVHANNPPFSWTPSLPNMDEFGPTWGFTYTGFPQASFSNPFVHAKIMSISGVFPPKAINEGDVYQVELVQIDPLFKVKFPRFSYRYKYEDGEYSVFAPWSEVAFIPQNFDYSPKKGYNLGMENSLRQLKVLNWRPVNCPKDVVEIDILYKESNSPNVYTVETFKKDDPIPVGEIQNYWDTPGNGSHFGKYTIKTELIHQVVASNQLLRPWDNVPRKALGQEITANRLIFANYLQQYDLKKIDPATSDMVSIKPSFLTTIEQNSPWEEEGNVLGAPAKSLKSQRTYQIGVVYRDKYGRETPILTSKSGSVEIKKEGAKYQNRLNVELLSDPPFWAESYTFYIKETSNEYYNIAMDRWYDAEDGGVWLSFPSVERNKINEDTNLILKKKHDSDEFTDFDVSYKVLSIQNNAPKFIKTDSKYWGSVPIMLPPPGWAEVGNWDTGMLHPTGLPLPNRMNVDVIAEYFDATVLKGLTGFNGAQIRIVQSPGMPSAFNSVTQQLSNVTKWYDVANISYMGAPPQTYIDANGVEIEEDGQPVRLARISLETAFGLDAMFCESDSALQPTIIEAGDTSNISMNRGLSIEVRTKEEKDKAKFEGRFFVKILRDANVEANIVQAQAVESDRYQVLQSKDIKYICVGHPGQQDWNHDATYYIPPGVDMGTANVDNENFEVSSFSKYIEPFGSSWIDDSGGTFSPGNFNVNANTAPFWPMGPGSHSNGVFHPNAWYGGAYWNATNAQFLNASDNFPAGAPNNPQSWPSFGPHLLKWDPFCHWGIDTNEYANITGSAGPYDHLVVAGASPRGILDLTMGHDGGGVNNQGTGTSNPLATWNNGNIINGDSFTSRGYLSGANPYMIPSIWGDQSDFLVNVSTCSGAVWPKGCQPVFNTGTMTKLRQHWYNLWRGRDDVDDSWPLGRFHPDRWFFDKVGAAQGGSGNGIWDDGDVSYMHLSYWGIGSESDFNRDSNTVLAAKHQGSELAFGDAMSTVGTQFRFKQDPDQTVYTVTDILVESDGIWNYEAPQGTWGYDDGGGTIIGGGGIFKEIAPPFGSNIQGTHLAGGDAFLSDIIMAQSDPVQRLKLLGGAPYNRRVRYTIKLDKIIGVEGANAFHPITNHVDGFGKANVKRGRQKYDISLPNVVVEDGGTPNNNHEWYNLNSYWNASDNAGDNKNVQPKWLDNHTDTDDNAPSGQTWYADNPNAYIGLHERGLNETTIEIISLYTGKDKDFPMSDNPAIWETEPKEDIGLDIYYAASPSFPVQLKRHRWDGKSIGSDFNTGGDEVDEFGANWYDYSHRGEEIIKVGSHVELAGFQKMKICAVQNDIIFIDRVVQLDDVSNTVQNMGQGVKIKISWNGEGTYYGVGKDTEWVEVYITEVIANSIYRIGQIENLGSYSDKTHRITHGLGYYNCYSYGTGVESNRIRDDFNAVTIDKGVKASMPLAEQYKEERKRSGLIFSGIYNSTSGINRTNEFIQAEPITKDLNPINGGIQKLFARDTDLVTFCENKVFKILANKDALFNADGNTNVTSNQAVLGQSIPFVGEYGMSRNPESFASESYRVYFTDKDRGAVLRLSKDGLTPISDAGMKDWFRDNLRFATSLIGSYDDRDDQYNLTLETSDQDGIEKAYTVSYTEKTRGWVSFKSFIQQAGISHKNVYYTFPSNKYNSINTLDPWGEVYGVGSNTAEAHQHSLDIILKRLVSQPVNNSDIVIVDNGQGVILEGMNVEGDGIPTDTRVLSVSCSGNYCNIGLDFALAGNKAFVNTNTELTFTTARNRFYGVDSYSMVKVMFNGDQGSVKRFKTLNYEGSQAKIEFDHLDPTKNTGNFHEIDGQVIGQDYYDNHPKLGWYAHDISTDMQKGKLSEFIDKENKWFNYIRGYEDAMQGDFLDTAEFSLQGLGYADVLITPVYGCTDSNAGNLYDPTANIDDGSCFTGEVGCMDPNSYNYCVTCIVDDPGSCEDFVYGCTDASAFNYDGNANTDDGSCIPVITGCNDPAAFNYQPDVGNPLIDINTPTPNSCIDVVLGCTDPNGGGYDANANTDDGSCQYFGCTDANAANYDPNANNDDGSCVFDDVGCTNSTSPNYDPAATGAGYDSNGFWQGCPWEFPGCPLISQEFPACNNGTYNNGSGVVHVDDQPYVVNNGNTDILIDGVLYGMGMNIPVDIIEVDGFCDYDCLGCTDPTACNYDAGAIGDDGSCILPNGCTCDPGTYPGGCANYDANATCDDGTCVPHTYGCTDPNADNGSYDDTATAQDNSCEYNGCQDASYFNYSAQATHDCSGVLGGTDVSCCTNFVYGCTDPTQSNYDSDANTDDGSCIPFTYGCMDPTAVNYNPSVTADDGSCLWLGCTEPTACNYDPGAGVNDGTCVMPDGCTDPTADNYDANAICDDGSCTYTVPGCTDPTYVEYNPLATIDDGSCITPAACATTTEPCNISVTDNGNGSATFTWDQDAGCDSTNGTMKSIIHIGLYADFSGANNNITTGSGQTSPYTKTGINASYLDQPIYVRAKCKGGNNVWTNAPGSYTITS